jgi:hypothetical protein
VDQEESYFDADDEEPNTVVPPAVDEVAAQEVENELHRTPRMFSLAQAPLLNNAPLRIEENHSNEMNGNPPEPKNDGEAKTKQRPTLEE